MICFRVEADRGLVEHQHVGPVQNGGREPDALLVPLGERVDDFARDVLQKTVGEDLPDRLLGFGAAQAFEPRSVSEILGDPHLGIERDVLRQVPDVAADVHRIFEEVVPGNPHPPGRRRQKAGDHPDRRGLAGAVGTQHADDLTVIDGEGDRVDRREVAVGARQILYLDHEPSCFRRAGERPDLAVLPPV